MSHSSQLQSAGQFSLISAFALVSIGGFLLSAIPVVAGQKVTIRRVILVNQAPNYVIYHPPQIDPLFLSPAIASPSFSNHYGSVGYGCFHPCITPYPAVGGTNHNIVNGSVVNSTLVNPVVVNSPIYNSTLVNPVIIERPRYRPGVRGSFSISF
ncbi:MULTISPECIES: hypothetical protein [Trichocoleus]|uniref:Uncharacterized protein n=1 Tax=Trichocoleus desertorum GB2-A4 TaxID=2933944 RepID=A0ABV0J3N5_9CYAN|nr:hypothetical protein [Trichocoleus sp. FACHB-46]MBD1861738.1 hypothetical protein [Trichocoleus sp. FACHB-46]